MVVNLSKQQFSSQELDLLNRGLKFAITPTHAPLEEIIVGIESGIQNMDNKTKNALRNDIEKKLLLGKNKKVVNNKTQNKNRKEILTLLREKDVIYTKADKGNAIVIMDRKDYDLSVEKMLIDGPYEKMVYKNGKPKDPLNQMIAGASKCAIEVSDLLGNNNLKFRFKVSNPRVACMYALPKIHKSPLSMRPISSNINIPMGELAKWAVEILRKYPINTGFSIKNSIELTEKIKHCRLEEGEILASFDITNMYPNIPADEAIQSLKRQLKKCDVPENIIHAIEKISSVCMSQNFFQFRGNFYNQNYGLGMGSKLSPILANSFITEMEERLKVHHLFPRIWYRYVDDIFVVVQESRIPDILKLLNSQHDRIKFTVEKEKDNCLPFLDILIKNVNGNIKFSIFRKPTHIDRYITSDSHHSEAQKLSAFHGMIHRLIQVPMEEEDFNNERNHIYKVATLNGFKAETIEKLIIQHRKRKSKKLLTTLSPITEKYKRISVPYFPKITNSLHGIFKKYGMQLITKSSTNLKNFICNYKDKEDPLLKSGIYSEFCYDCNMEYIGQCSRRIIDRHKEHKSATRHNQINKSAVAEHMQKNGHSIDDSKFRKLKTVHHKRYLDAWESLYINIATTELMNREPAPITSPLFKFASQ